MRQSPRARPMASPCGLHPRRRLAGLLFILVLLGGYLGLLLAPGGTGALRLAGVSLLWWYGGILAPVLAVVGIVLIWPRGWHQGDAPDAGGCGNEPEDRPAGLEAS